MERIAYMRETFSHHQKTQAKLLVQTELTKLIFDEPYDLQKPRLKACLSKLAKGDMLIVYSLGVLSDSITELILLLNYLTQKGVNLLSIRDKICTLGPQGQSAIQTFKALKKVENEKLYSLLNQKREANFLLSSEKGHM